MTSNKTTQEFLSSILQGSFNGIMAFKSVRDEKSEIIDFEWIYVNDIASELVGISSSELVGSRLLDVLPGNKEAGLFERYKGVVESREKVTFEQYYPGEAINKWFRISAVHLDDGFTVNFQDISDLKEALIEIETQEKKYRQLFQESIDPIFLADEKLNILECNQAFQGLFCEEDVKKTLKVKSLFADSSDFDRFYELCQNQGKIDEFEAELLNADSKKRHCLIHIVPLENESKKIKSYLGVVRDLTKRKRAERELVMAEKLSMTGKISRTIGHEVRNPLTNLSLALDQLRDELGEEREDSEIYLQIIERNLKRISKLISDLLDSSKIKELCLEKRSLNEVVNSTLSLVEDRLKLRNMVLEKSFEEDLPDILIDEDQLKVALLNLMINAIEAMEDDQGVLSIRTYEEDDYVNLDIIDNGSGISPENQSKLFEPFFTAKKEGTGLGLVTVQNIIQSHRGDIEVESEPGAGTKFRLCFPIGVEE
ncbi:ATP-binding protein [Algoriphagus sediminis]|uniref:histidine kinase n=1 Tax=Algoriphagus sediminis TaxID=3057113 RepID=A0ABT7YFF3_9BACT|nr:ATP-binding protein [Algoriphagus sediminis]MDN3205227.1 ATP-binding protein [Algoriphagus sediminis]